MYTYYIIRTNCLSAVQYNEDDIINVYVRNIISILFISYRIHEYIKVGSRDNFDVYLGGIKYSKIIKYIGHVCTYMYL